MGPSILVVDDESRLAEVLAAALVAHGFETMTAESADGALALLGSERIDLVISDLRMPDLSGRDLLHRIRQTRPDIPVIIMTAYASVRDAVALVKEGAFDYVAKPFEIDDVFTIIERALHMRAVVNENQRLRDEISGKYRFDQLIGRSAAFQAVLGQISDVCASRATVLIQGESGTGKEVVARAIHFNSPRSSKPFVAVNCAAIPEGLLESELFGHAKGAFTGATTAREGRFAMADGGSLFLDEVGDMAPALQAKVLRVLQEQSFEPVGSNRTIKVDVRIVAATHKDLKEMAVAGTFRDDLFYRLNVFPMSLPALRDRAEDIPMLAAHFLKQYADDMGKKLTGFTPAAEAAMAAYGWPGNIRELQNCVERSVIVARAIAVDAPDLPRYVFEGVAKETSSPRIPSNLDAELERIETEFILDALRKTGGVQVKAASLLGVSERSLWHRIKKLGIKIEWVAGAG
jgi:two-component system, NtrC family, response regulator AtoC